MKDLAYELGRYRKAVGDRDKLIARLREDLDGQQEALQAATAIIGMLVLQVAGEKGEVILPREVLSKAIGGDQYRFHSRIEGDNLIVLIEEKRE